MGDDEHLLDENRIEVNGEENKTVVLKNLLYQQPNKNLLGFPLRLHIYNLARPNLDSILNERIYENPEKLRKKTMFLFI